MGDCYSALDRWLDLESLARGSNWRQLEALRLAFLARAQAKQNNSEKSQTTWNLALDAARKQSSTPLLPLLAMARVDKRDVREVLWLIVEKDASQIWARQELYDIYAQDKDCEGMLRIMELVLKENPNDRAAKYYVAGLLMVLERETDRAVRLARGLHESDPQNLRNAIVYAYGLKLQGEPAKGAQIVDLRDDLHQLENAGKAYYALILSACGRTVEAGRFAASVHREKLMPELRAAVDPLFESVSASSGAKPRPF